MRGLLRRVGIGDGGAEALGRQAQAVVAAILKIPANGQPFVRPDRGGRLRAVRALAPVRVSEGWNCRKT